MSSNGRSNRPLPGRPGKGTERGRPPWCRSRPVPGPSTTIGCSPIRSGSGSASWRPWDASPIGDGRSTTRHWRWPTGWPATIPSVRRPTAGSWDPPSSWAAAPTPSASTSGAGRSLDGDWAQNPPGARPSPPGDPRGPGDRGQPDPRCPHAAQDEPTPLVRRDRERTTLAALLDGVLDGEGAVADRRGVGGGQDQVARRSGRRWRWRGISVLWGGSSPSGGLPFGPIAEALGTCTASASAGGPHLAGAARPADPRPSIEHRTGGRPRSGIPKSASGCWRPSRAAGSRDYRGSAPPS